MTPRWLFSLIFDPWNILYLKIIQFGSFYLSILHILKFYKYRYARAYFSYELLSRKASSVLRASCYQWGSCVGGPSAFNSPSGHAGSRSNNIAPLDNHLCFIDIVLKLGAQLSILTAIFQVFGLTRLWFKLTTSGSGCECSTITLS